MTNKITQAERDEINAAAYAYLMQDISRKDIAGRLMDEFGISEDRAIRAISKARLKRNRPGAGAPAGNQNAVRSDGQPRRKLNVRIEQSTFDWLQSQADAITDGNIGRYLDTLPQ